MTRVARTGRRRRTQGHSRAPRSADGSQHSTQHLNIGTTKPITTNVGRFLMSASRLIRYNVALLVVCAWGANAQCIEQRGEVLDYSDEHPGEYFLFGAGRHWAGPIRDASHRDAFNVSGYARYPGNIIWADEVRFSPKSTLEFTNLNAPFWAIVARKLIFEEGEIAITRSTSYVVEAAKNGSHGESGIEGSRKTGWLNGRHGHHGDSGRSGSAGMDGASGKSVPCLIIIAQTVQLLQPTVSVNLDGFDGGRGGNGGNGGNGGDGERGRKGASSALRCERQCGNGGNGGHAGSGGAAGAGGNGGDGGDFVFIGNRRDGMRIMSLPIRNAGGTGGKPGTPGKAGIAGRGGLKA